MNNSYRKTTVVFNNKPVFLVYVNKTMHHAVYPLSALLNMRQTDNSFSGEAYTAKNNMQET